jgi:hypothetical protein
MTPSVRRSVLVSVLPILLLSSTACDIVTADLKESATSQWRKTYELRPGMRLELSNVNGKIDVSPSTGTELEVVADKRGRGTSQEAAKQALDRVEIVEDVSASAIRIETKLPRSTGFLSGSVDVTYTVRVPNGADVKFTTVNGGIEISRIQGQIVAETTNGGITARDIAGAIDATTVNGGLDVDLSKLSERGVKLGCTNGGIKLRLPSDAAATISASVSNGGINAEGLPLETSESNRRTLEGRLNGGGPRVRLESVHGGIRIGAR